MDNLRKRLEKLLLKEDWSKDDCNWLNEYLQKEDLSVLREVARKQFDDMRAAERLIEERLSNKMLKNIHAEIHKKKKRKRLYRVTLAAASVLLLFIVGIGFFNAKQAHRELSYIEVNTRPGQTKEIRLEDGTRVWLGPGGSLRYPERFTGDYREVEVSGEAFFDVSRDGEHPFIVKSRFLKIKVLGTSFNVNTYEDRDYATVTVATGEVAVEKTNTSAINRNKVVRLRPNQRVVFKAGDGLLVKKKFPDAKKILYGRRNGILQYNGMDLQMVVQDLSVQYATTIKLGKSLRNYTYYGSFNVKQDSLATSLKLLCLALHVDLVKADGYYIIGK